MCEYYFGLTVFGRQKYNKAKYYCYMYAYTPVYNQYEWSILSSTSTLF